MVRQATEEDVVALAQFRCSTGPWYEQEVESFVRGLALKRVLKLLGDHRLLVVLDRGRLVCCMAHHEEFLFGEGKAFDPIPATRLHLLAIAVEDQGCRLEDGTRLSDVVMATLIADALQTREATVLTAIVALDNLRSMALCRRHGLRSQVRYDARHARLSGHFKPRVLPLTPA